MTSLLDIPELAQKALLDHLLPQEIANLRRVCSTTKGWVAEYLPPLCVIGNSKEKESSNSDPVWRYEERIHKGSVFAIDGINNTFESLINFELRTFGIHIGNGTSKIEAAEPFAEFRDVYTPGPAFDLCVTRNFPYIRKVTVKHFHGNVSATDWSFFNSLTAMDWLEIGTIWIDEIPTADKPLRFPPTFKNLKYIKVCSLHVTKESFEKSKEVRTYHWRLLRFCSKTESILRPLVLCGKGEKELMEVREDEVEDGPPGQFKEEGIIGWIKQIVSERTDKQNPVKEIDMRFIEDDGVFGTSVRKYFKTLITFCGQRNIKLRNVHSHLFHRDNPFDVFLQKEPTLKPGEAMRYLEMAVKSLLNLSDYINPNPMLGVERIGITSMYNSAANYGEPRNDAPLPPLDRSTYLSPPPPFPKLKDIYINLDVDTEKYGPKCWDHFLRGLLSIPRPNVHRLTIIFERKTAEEGQGDGSCRTLTDPKFLRPVWLCNNFQAVTKLALKGWDAKNIQFLQIWKAMTQLEGLSLEDCRTLGNVGFVGEDPYDPVFLKLTKLKKLILIVTYTPKITDRVFKDVFSKMKLVNFHLISKTPIGNITSEGIRALANVDSEFSKSIRTFPFSFSLAGVTPEELKGLKELFRCHQ